jgi:hypothetical protein
METPAAAAETAAPMTHELRFQRATVPVHVPGWVRFMARNSDGEWWGYESEPLIDDAVDGWYCAGGSTFIGRAAVYGNFPGLNDWRASVIAVGVAA